MSPAKLTAWLQRTPDTARTLQLLFIGIGEPELIDAWEAPFDSLSQLAREVIDAAQEHATEEDARCRYYVRWLDAGNATVTQTVHKARPQDTRGTFKPGSSAQDTHHQTSRHVEAMAKLHIGGMLTAIKTLEGQNAALREENKELRGVVRDLFVHMQSQATGDEEDALKTSAIMEKLGGYVETYLLPAVAERVASRAAGDVRATANGADTSGGETEH